MCVCVFYLNDISTRSPPVCAGSSGHLPIKCSDLCECRLVHPASNLFFLFLSFVLVVDGPVEDKALKRCPRDLSNQRLHFWKTNFKWCFPTSFMGWL